MSARRVALDILHRVIERGQSLNTARKVATELESRDRAFVMELVLGVLRKRWTLEFILSQLMKKPLRSKEAELRLLLLMTLYEQMELHTPDYAVVDEAVKLSKKLGKQWASGLVNAVLRNFSRNQSTILAGCDQDELASYSHPEWLIALIQKDWPQNWQQILTANNQRPPLWLRVNTRHQDRQSYQVLLNEQGLESSFHPFATEAVKLQNSLDVTTLPGFESGRLSVQDANAQLCADCMDLQPGQSILDLCAAPGGKTCHLLEREPALKTLVAVDLEAERLARVEQNLERLQLEARLIVADASQSSSWWDGELFDRVLVDAPCSASGVIRRHPDIKSLRRPEDIQSLCDTQLQILQQAWELLKPGGKLLYVTCSVLRDENEKLVMQLLNLHDDAAHIELDVDWGIACQYGRQLLPGENDGDGFYYALLGKR